MAEQALPRDPAAYAQWLDALAAEPWKHDFYQTLRRIEAAHPQLPRLGEAQRPADEPLRLAQPAELSFAPAPLSALRRGPDGRPRLEQRIFGLLGPNGALPTHLTELARERAHQHGDHTLQRFCDLLSHRFTLLFYRAWAQAQPVVSLDRPGDNSFARRLGALIGLGSDSLLGRDAAPDAAKLHFAGRLARQVRDADGLLNWCRAEFDVPLRIEQWCGHWMPLARAERSRLGQAMRRNEHGLGQGAVLGSAAWDVQHKFRIVIGPLSLARYRAFLPGGQDLARLQAMVRHWIGLELAWDLRLILKREQVPRLQLRAAPEQPDGKDGRLGRSAWLGHYRRPRDADQLLIDVEHTLRGPRRAPSDTNPRTQP
jgi:type VI secretion system protein ImpH